MEKRGDSVNLDLQRNDSVLVRQKDGSVQAHRSRS